MRKPGLVLFVAAVAAAALAVATVAAPHNDVRPPSQVINGAGEPGAVSAKAVWAQGQAAKAFPGRSYWIGYSIERLQGERSTIGSYWGDGRARLTVAEVLAGKIRPEQTGAVDIRKDAAAALDRIDKKGQPEKQVLKELAFFLKYEAGRPGTLSRVEMSNLDLSFDFEGLPLYWLGRAPEDQSLTMVRDLYGRENGEEARKGLVAAAGCHGNPKLVLPFLESVLSGPGSDELRKDAAFWIGQQNDPESLRVLAQAARTDRSEEVREGAVFAISEIELPAAVDELITLAKGADRHDVRKQAVFWLSQIASKKSGPVLEGIAESDPDLEIQEQAVFALSELPGDEGLDALIRLARTHKDARIRKKAVFWLGESENPKALEAIIAIIKGK